MNKAPRPEERDTFHLAPKEKEAVALSKEKEMTVLQGMGSGKKGKTGKEGTYHTSAYVDGKKILRSKLELMCGIQLIASRGAGSSLLQRTKAQM